MLLNEDSFDKYIDVNTNTIVMFYSPQCSYCDEIILEFEKANKILTNYDI